MIKPLLAASAAAVFATGALANDHMSNKDIVAVIGWFTTTFEMVFWDPDARWSVGQTRRLDGLVAEVRAITPDGRPRAVRFTFDLPLEDPSLRFMRVAADGTLQPLELPRPRPTSFAPGRARSRPFARPARAACRGSRRSTASRAPRCARSARPTHATATSSASAWDRCRTSTSWRARRA